MQTVAIDKREHQAPASVYCPLCTHTVHATVTFTRHSAKVVPGQKCPRCASSLDAGYVFGVNRAA